MSNTDYVVSVEMLLSLSSAGQRQHIVNHLYKHYGVYAQQLKPDVEMAKAEYNRGYIKGGKDAKRELIERICE